MQRYGVARGTAAQAVRPLVDEGLLRIVPEGSRTRNGPPSGTNPGRGRFAFLGHIGGTGHSAGTE
jgi:hypothetical protein